MATFILKDMMTGDADAMIHAECEITGDEIERIIQDVKDANECSWCWEDIVEALAENGVYLEVISELTTVWY